MTNRITPDIERRTSRSGRADRRVANRNVEMTPFSGFRGDIGGLRGVAVLLVLTSHLNLGFDNGFVGVDVFFVISGFLITGLMLKEYGASLETGQGGRVSLSSFYARRARRILPAAVLCLVLTVAVANAILNSGAAAEVERDALWSLLFAANIDLIASSTDYFQQGFAVSPLQNFWSLAVEEQFYIVWPTLIVLVLALHGLTVRRRQFRWSTRVLTLVCILVVASFVWSVISATTEPQVGYFSTLTRAWELGIGAGTACLVFMTRRAPSYWWGVVGAMSIIATLVFMPAGMPFPGWVAIFPVVGTALVLASGAARQGPVYAALNIAPLRFFGLVSYSLYLFHWPIIVLFSRLMPDWDMWPRALVLAAASVGVATVSYYLVEKPTLAHLPKFSFEASKSTSGPLAPRLTAIAFSSALALAAVVVFAPVAYEQTAYAHGLSLRAEPATYTPPPNNSTASNAPVTPSAEELGVLADAWRTQVRASVGLTTISSSLSPSLLELADRKGEQPGSCSARECTTGHGPLNALLIGNSFADMMYPMVQQAFPGQDWTVRIKWRSGCQLGAADDCPQIFDITGEQVDLLIISDYAYIDQNIDRKTRDSNIASELASYTSQVRHVVYLGQVPGVEKALIDCVDASGSFGPGCASDRERVATINGLKAAAASAAGAVFIDPTDWVCDGNACPVVIGDAPTYVDTQHLTSSVASALGPTFRLSILPLVEPLEATIASD